jgi:hypothetical protein
MLRLLLNPSTVFHALQEHTRQFWLQPHPTNVCSVLQELIQPPQQFKLLHLAFTAKLGPFQTQQVHRRLPFA